MIRILASLSVIALLWSSPAMADVEAGIFFYGTAPTPAQVTALVKDAEITTATKGKVTYVNVKWPDVSVSITIDPVWDREVQLSGIRGWLSEFPAKDRNAKPVTAFLADLDRVTTCYGSVITPTYDKAGKAAALLKQLVAPTGGFVFTHQSFYNAGGMRIIGLAGDPATIGPK